MTHTFPFQRGGRHRRHEPRHGFDGPPFGHRGRGPGMVRRGEVRPLILAALAARPMHGYELIGELESRSGGRWRPSAGSIYPALQQLADEGLVTGRDVEGRRVYTITDAGQAAAAANPGTPWTDRDRHGGDDIGHLVRRVAEAAMQVRKVGSDAAVREAVALLAETRASLYRLLAEDAPATGGESDSDAPLEA